VIKPIRVSEFIIKNKTAQNVFKQASLRPALTHSLIVCSMATTIKPLSIMATKSNAEDKKYSAVKSAVDGLIDVGFTGAIFLPISKALDEVKDKLLKNENLIYSKSPKTLDGLKLVFDRGLRLAVVPLKIGITLAVLPKVVDSIFKRDKS
jgi:hypothetical protein